MSVVVEFLDRDGRGVAHVQGKAVLIEGALPGERVDYSVYKATEQAQRAAVTRIERQSFTRVEPRCRYFGVCGGCSMQHLEFTAQVAAKQRILEENLKGVGNVRPGSMLRPIYGPAWGYRQRARLSVRYVAKKGGVLVGFHEKRSSFIADMERCEILPARISALIGPLRDLIGRLSIRRRLPQVEVALGEAVDVLVLRILESLTAEDEALLRAFAERHRLQFWLQPKGPDSAYPFHPVEAAELYYSLPEFGITMPFRPTEFTQVNGAVNRVLVRRAVQWLDPGPGERIADLFCGLGNFTLPIARRGGQVLGVEGSPQLVQRAQSNAARNGVRNVSFCEADLLGIGSGDLAQLGHFDKMLIDPPRDGAAEVVKALGDAPPRRIVYVSCNPATLARDAAVLVHTRGYVLKAAGVVNMFPHTAHVESIAVFDR